MLIKIKLRGDAEKIVKKMIERGWAETPEEAVRFALHMLFLELRRNRFDL
jgi:hypothetical protein